MAYLVAGARGQRLVLLVGNQVTMLRAPPDAREAVPDDVPHVVAGSPTYVGTTASAGVVTPIGNSATSCKWVIASQEDRDLLRLETVQCHR